MSKIFRRGIDSAIKRLEDPQRINRHNPETIFQRIGLKGGMTFADLGCGTGFFALPASRIIGANGMVYAVDFTPEVLEVLRTKIAQQHIANMKVIESDIRSTKIDDASIDVVLMANVFHDVEKESTLGECKRILRSTGTLLIIDWKKIATENGPPLEVRIDEEEVIRIIQQNNLSVTTQFEAGPAHYAIVVSKK